MISPCLRGLWIQEMKSGLSVAAGERSKHIVELRENGAQEIYVDVAEGAELALTYIQFAPTDACREPHSRKCGTRGTVLLYACRGRGGTYGIGTARDARGR